MNQHPGNSQRVEGVYLDEVTGKEKPIGVDHETGKLMGIKITACRACGHVRQVSVMTGLCGRGSCIKKRTSKKKED